MPVFAQEVIRAPSSVISDGAGGLYVASPRGNKIYRVAADGTVTVAAGIDIYGFRDNRPATSGQLASPEAIAMDAAGNLFIADTQNHRIRKVDAEGMITTVAGSGTIGFDGDGGPAASAHLFAPEGIAVDLSGNIFIAEPGNHRIRKIGRDTIITTYAGTGNPGFSGDGGPAASAEIAFPRAVAVDSDGNLFIIVAGNRIRKVSQEGTISTVAGTGTAGFSGDGGPAASAEISSPMGLAADAAGNLYIADTRNQRVRKVNPDGIMTTVAGNGTCCFSGDGGPATSAQLNFPQSVAVDAEGNLFIAESGDRIRKVSPDGIVRTFVGN